MANSFSSQGATPMATSSLTGLSVPGSITGSTPQARALSGIAPGSMASNANLVTSALGSAGVPKNTATPYNANIAPVTAGLIPKSQTINNVDGSSHTVTYQAPPAQPTTAATTSEATPTNQSTATSGGASTFSLTPEQMANAKTPQELAQQASTGSSGATTGMLAPQAETQSTFSGLVGDLANASKNPNPEIAALENQAADIASHLGPAEAAVLGSPGIAADQEGRESNLAAAAGAQLSGLGNVLSQANTAQSNLQSGLSNAASVTAPSVGAFGQTQYFPLNAGNTGATVSPSDPFYSTLQSYAQQAANGQYGAIPSSITSNPVLNAQLNQMASAINPSYNPVVAGAQSAATASNVQSLGTAGTAGIASVLQSIPALQSANTAAKGIANQITSFLQQNPQLNQSNSTLATAAQQWLNGKQLGDPAYQTLFNDLNEYTNTLAPILGVGGDATNLKTQIAQGFINAQASGQSIATVLQNIGALADTKVQNLASGATGGGVVNPTQNGTSSSLYSF